MNLRLALYQLAQTHGLSPRQGSDLQRLAGIGDEPRDAARWLQRGVAVLAAALAGFGVILWLAANWADLGRAAKFGLLEGLVMAALLGAVLRPQARAPLLLLGLLAQGGLLAFFGQTYQTGAEPWQLFALWAALALPLALAGRSDVLWVPFALVAVTAAALWTYAHTGHSWLLQEESASLYLAGWLMTLAVALGLSPWPRLRAVTGAGPWSFRTAVTLAVATITLTALSALFGSHVQGYYFLGLLVLAAAGLGLVRARLADAFALSALGFALDTLLICGLARVLFENARGEWLGNLFILGLVAAGLVAGTVAFLKPLLQRPTAGEEA